MRRIDAIGITLGLFVAGGLAFIVLKVAGLDSFGAGIWSQLLLVGGLVGWVLTYALRVTGNKMTYHQQRRAYEEAYLQKKFEELGPEELAKIQAEIEREEQQNAEC